MADTLTTGSAQEEEEEPWGPYKTLPERIAAAQEAVRTGAVDDLEWCVEWIERNQPTYTSQQDALDLAVDAETGDTLLHIAAACGQLESIRAVSTLMNNRLKKSRYWEYTFATRKNKSGNTALHMAARQDSLEALRYIYHLCCYARFPGEDRPGTLLEEDLKPSVPNDPDDNDANCLLESDVAFRIVILTPRNNDGRTPADEARHYGQSANLALLEKIMGNIDPEGKHKSDSAVESMKESVRKSGYVIGYLD